MQTHVYYIKIKDSDLQQTPKLRRSSIPKLKRSRSPPRNPYHGSVCTFGITFSTMLLHHHPQHAQIDACWTTVHIERSEQ
jgi:hypothetical protein